MKRQVLTILTALVVATHGLLAQQWTEIMRIETIDSTIVLPVADVKRFAFDYINETYGSIDNFLKDICGVDDAKRQILRQKYLYE